MRKTWMTAGVLVAVALAGGVAGAQAAGDDDCCACQEQCSEGEADSDGDTDATWEEPVFGVPDLNAPPFAP